MYMYTSMLIIYRKKMQSYMFTQLINESDFVKHVLYNVTKLIFLLQLITDMNIIII